MENNLKENFYIQKNYPTLQLIFFDGEEAIQGWSMTDSLYGSRYDCFDKKNENFVVKLDI
jgi:hypothetical protein